MAVITDAERKKQRKREVKREYYAKKQRKEGCAEQRIVSQKTRRRISTKKQ